MHDVRRPQTRVGQFSLDAFAIGVLLFLMTPLVVVVGVSFSGTDFLTFPPRDASLRWYRSLVEDDVYISSALLSLKIAAGAVAISLVFGGLIALALSQGRLLGRTVVRVTSLAPLVVPYVVLGLGLFYVMLKLGLRGTDLSIVIAHGVVALPFVVLFISAGLSAIPSNLSDAAASLGANKRATLMRITLPLIAPSVAASAVVAFVVSWDEFILAFLLSTPGNTKTLPVVIFGLLRDRVEPSVAAAASLMILFTVIITVVFWLVRGRNLESDL